MQLPQPIGLGYVCPVYGILYISNSPAAKAYVPPAQKG